MKARYLCILLTLVVVLLLSMEARATEYREDNKEVNASDILTHIENGDDIHLDNCRIVGELNISKLKLETVTKRVNYFVAEEEDPFFFDKVEKNESFHLVESNITITHSIFVNKSDFSYVMFNHSADFKGSRFNCSENFMPAIFNDSVDFNSVTFNDSANFNSVTFNDSVDFNSVTFNDSVDFNSVTFNNLVDFSKSRFNNSANFILSGFNNSAKFSDVTFNDSADFRFTTFNDSADFDSVNFNDFADFKYVTFNDSAIFNFATFNDIHTSYVTYLKDVTIILCADFRFATFNGSTYFDSVTFNDSADFSYVKFNDAVEFNGAMKFNGSVKSDLTTFKRSAIFEHTVFNNSTDFEYVTFNDFVNFNHVIFNSTADFKYVTFNNSGKFIMPDTSERIITDGKTCEFFRKSYNNEARYTDADNIYFTFRRLSMDEEDISFSKLVDILSWVTCGYGTNLYYTLRCIVFLVTFFAIAYMNPGITLAKIGNKIIFPKFYWRKPGIYRSSEENYENKSSVSFLECLCFSINTFTRLGSANWRQRDGFWYIVTIEGIFGWIMLGIFLATLMHLLIKP